MVFTQVDQGGHLLMQRQQLELPLGQEEESFDKCLETHPCGEREMLSENSWYPGRLPRAQRLARAILLSTPPFGNYMRPAHGGPPMPRHSELKLLQEVDLILSQIWGNRDTGKWGDLSRKWWCLDFSLAPNLFLGTMMKCLPVKTQLPNFHHQRG